MGEYTAYTKSLKNLKGQRTDHITLKDSGDFYNSFRVVLRGSTLIIEADPIKEDTNLFREYGIDIVGLTEENMSVVTTVALKLIKPEIRRLLLK